MSVPDPEEFVAIQRAFLQSKMWHESSCPNCGLQFFSKTSHRSCESASCRETGSAWEVPAPKGYLDLNDIISASKAHFAGAMYRLHPPLDLVRQKERTLFVSTAGQVYDKYIYGDGVAESDGGCFLVQPVVRLQEIDRCGESEGYTSSFVHLATEEAGCTYDAHLRHFDQWLSFLSAIGIYAGSLCLEVERIENDWGGLRVEAISTSLNYFGLEIGIANLFFVPRKNGTLCLLSDIGAGAERLTWARNKTPSFFDAIGPRTFIVKRKTCDAIRSSVLIASAGVKPGHNDHASKLRLLLQRAAGAERACNLFEICNYYYGFWQTIYPLRLTHEKTYEIIRSELMRNTNLRLNSRLKINETPDQSTESLVRRILKERKKRPSYLFTSLQEFT